MYFKSIFISYDLVKFCLDRKLTYSIKKMSVGIRVLNLSLKELELNVKNRGIKDYIRMSIDKLLSILDATEPIKK